MNYSQLKNEICDQIDSILALYWSNAGQASHQAATRQPTVELDQVQLQGGAHTGFEQRNSSDGPRRGRQRRAFRRDSLRWAQQHSAICDRKIMKIAFSRAGGQNARFGLRKFGE